MPSCESESGGESGWVIRSGIACHDITTSSVNIKYTGGMLMLTFIHMLDGSSVACHELTASGVSIEHNGGMVMIFLFHMLSGCPTTACGHWFGDWAGSLGGSVLVEGLGHSQGCNIVPSLCEQKISPLLVILVN